MSEGSSHIGFSEVGPRRIGETEAQYAERKRHFSSNMTGARSFRDVAEQKIKKDREDRLQLFALVDMWDRMFDNLRSSVFNRKAQDETLPENKWHARLENTKELSMAFMVPYTALAANEDVCDVGDEKSESFQFSYKASAANEPVFYVDEEKPHADVA